MVGKWTGSRVVGFLAEIKFTALGLPFNNPIKTVASNSLKLDSGYVEFRRSIFIRFLNENSHVFLVARALDVSARIQIFLGSLIFRK